MSLTTRVSVCTALMMVTDVEVGLISPFSHPFIDVLIDLFMFLCKHIIYIMFNPIVKSEYPCFKLFCHDGKHIANPVTLETLEKPVWI